MESHVPWPESMYDRAMRARVAISDAIQGAIDRHVAMKVAGAHGESSLGTKVFSDGTEHTVDHFSSPHDAVCVTLKAVEFEVVKIIQSLADSLPAFSLSEDEGNGSETDPPGSDRSHAVKAAKAGSGGSEAPGETVALLHAKLQRGTARVANLRAKCSHLEFQVEALKTHCLRKDAAVQYIRETLFQEVTVLREQLHRQSQDPQFCSSFVSLFDYAKLLEGAIPNSVTAHDALQLVRKEHAAEMHRTHAVHAAAIRAKTEELEALRADAKRLRDTNERLQEEYNGSPTRRGGSGPDDVDQREQFRMLREELSARDAAIEELRSAMAGMRGQMAEDQRVTKGLREQLQRMSDETEDLIDGKNREIQSKAQLVADLEVKLAALESTKTKLQLSSAKGEKLATEAAELRSVLRELEAQVPKLQAERDELQERNMRLIRRLESLEASGSEAAAMQTRALQGQLAKAEEGCARAEHELGDLRDRLDFATSELAHAQHELKMTSTEAADLRAQVARLKDAVAATHGEYSNAAVLAEDRDSTIHTLRKQLTERVAAAEELRAANAALEEQCAAMHRDLEELQRRGPGTSAEHAADALAAAMNERRTLSKENGALKRHVQALNAESVHLRDQVAVLEAELGCARDAGDNGGSSSGASGGRSQPSAGEGTSDAPTPVHSSVPFETPPDVSLPNPTRTYSYHGPQSGRPPSAGRRDSGSSTPGLVPEGLGCIRSTDADNNGAASGVSAVAPVLSGPEHTPPAIASSSAQGGARRLRAGSPGSPSVAQGTDKKRKKKGQTSSPHQPMGGHQAVPATSDTMPQSTTTTTTAAAASAASASPAAIGSSHLLERLAAVTTAKAEADAQVVALAAQVAQLSAQLAKAKGSSKAGGRAPGAATPERVARSADAAVPGTPTTQLRRSASTPTDLPLRRSPIGAPTSPSPEGSESAAVAPSARRPTQSPAAFSDRSAEGSAEGSGGATADGTLVAHLREENAGLKAALVRLQTSCTASRPVSAVVERCAASCAVAGAQYSEFSQAIKAAAADFGVLEATARQDHGRAMLTCIFPRVRDGFEWGKRVLGSAVGEQLNGDSDPVRVQVGLTHGVCAAEDGAHFGPAPTRSLALAVSAVPGTLAMSDAAAERLELELRAGRSGGGGGGPAAGLLLGEGELCAHQLPMAIREDRTRMLRCPTDASGAVGVRCIALRNDCCSSSVGGGLQDGDLASDPRLDSAVVWDPVPVLSPSARMQHDFFVGVTQRRGKAMEVGGGSTAAATVIASKCAALLEPSPPAPAADDAEGCAAGPGDAVLPSDVAHRSVQCLLLPAAVKGEERCTGADASDTRARVTVAGSQAVATCASVATQTNVTTDPESIFATSGMSSQHHANTVRASMASPIAMMHEQLLELHHTPAAQVRRGFSAHRRMVRAQQQQMQQQQQSAFDGLDSTLAVGDGANPTGAPAATAQHSPPRGRPHSACGLPPHHQQGGRPRKRRVGSAAPRAPTNASCVASSAGQDGATQQLTQLVQGLADRSKINALRGAGGGGGSPTALTLEPISSWARYPLALSHLQQQGALQRPSSGHGDGHDHGSNSDGSSCPSEGSDCEDDDFFSAPEGALSLNPLREQPDVPGAAQRPPTPATIDTRQHMTSVFLGGGRGAAVRGVKEKLHKSVDVAAFLSLFQDGHFRPTPTNQSPNSTPYVDARRRKGATRAEIKR